MQKDGHTTFEGAGLLGQNTITISALHAERTLPAGMVYVPRSAVQIQQSSVGLPSFYLDTYEVSNREEGRRFTNAGELLQAPEFWTGPFIRMAARRREEALREFRDATGRPGPSTWELGTYPDGQEDAPVQGISWYEAEAYAQYAGKTLPTVHHWRGRLRKASTPTSSS